MQNKKIKQIQKELFSEEIQGYEIKTKDLGVVNYLSLDSAATVSPFKKVQEDIDKYLVSYGSVHRGAGEKSKVSTDIYEDSRNIIKDFVKARKNDYVLFTGNTTGAMNSAAHYFSFLEGKVAVSNIEHSSSWLPWVKAEGIKKTGDEQVNFSDLDNTMNRIQDLGRKQVIQYDVNENFEFDLKNIEEVLKNNSIKVFVLTASSNATGYMPDIKKIGNLVHKYRACFMVDGCQFIQHHEMNMQEMGIDFLAASGHKFYAPYGGGFLIGPKDFFDKFISYEIGGGNLPYITKEGEFLRYKNQLAHDPGTPNAVGAVAMASALKQLKEIGLKNVEGYEYALTKKVFDKLKNNSKIDLYVSEKHLSTIIPFNIKGIDSRKVAKDLNDRFGIGVRAGSFCVYNVMRNLLNIEDESEIINKVKNREENAVPGFVRISFSLMNTENDVDRIIDALEILTK